VVLVVDHFVVDVVDFVHG
ncbi:hypothetical protein A2U01_0101639, partial [Trifolium medium]|nr:hypothetical protein [Trifolium medium]